MRGVGALILIVLGAGTARAADLAPDTVAVGVASVYGSARTDYPDRARSEVHGEIGALMLSGAFAPLPNLWLEARGAVVMALVGLPAGGAIRSAVFANPELGVTHVTYLVPGLRLATSLALAAPLGDHDALDGQTLALGDSLTGGARTGLFARGRLTTTPAAELTWKLAPGESTRVVVGAFAATPLALALTDGERTDQRRLGVAVVGGARAGATLFRRLTLTVDGWTRVEAVRPVVLAEAPSPGPAWVLAPRVGYAGKRFTFGGGALIHLDGDIGPARLGITGDLTARF
jgi:hypothetical protein